MSNKVRNIIAGIVAGIAIAGIASVIVLACISISPMEKVGWKDYSSVDLFYGGNQLAVNADGPLDGEGTNPDNLTIDDIFGKMNFSLFSTCIQFNYQYGLTYKDNSKLTNNELTASELKDIVSTAKSGSDKKYSFIITKKDTAEIELYDFWGRKQTIEYDTVLFTVDTENASDWPKAVDAYLYVRNRLYSVSQEPGINADSYTYYSFKFSAKTSSLIEALDEIYDIDSDAEAESEESGDSEEE